jgi:hypothetical protein
MIARSIPQSFLNSILIPHFDRIRDEATFEAVKHLAASMGETKTVWFLIDILPFTISQAVTIVRAAAQGDSTPFFNTPYTF